MNQRQLARERSHGEAWFKSLVDADKWELGDQFVLGTFDWRDWADMAGWSKKPSRAFLQGAETARLQWEMVQ